VCVWGGGWIDGIVDEEERRKNVDSGIPTHTHTHTHTVQISS